ncbi:MAG: type I-E CRISPR-associated protein Cas7/Cse4/CasC [Polyangiales bacterium]
MTNRFIQVHFLTSYAATLLNRDDVGFAKRIPFGGAVRTRVSSQCLKRHWRAFDGEHSLRSLGEDMSLRSRQTFEQKVVAALLAEGHDEAAVRALAAALRDVVLGAKEKKADDGDAKKADKKGAGKGKKGAEAEAPPADGEGGGERAVNTDQVTVLGLKEVEFFQGIVRDLVKAGTAPGDARKAVEKFFTKERVENLRGLKRAAGLDAALFGRMVTSDYLARGDAALHVAHALTVHEELTENDYFSAVDELKAGRDDESLGSGHIGTSELTSGLFYGYVAVDVPLLVSNLEGCKREAWEKADRALAGRVIDALVHMVATVSPGAKLGATAPHANAHAVIVESGNGQPRTLANAFVNPVVSKARDQRQHDLVGNTYDALAAYVADLDENYGATERRWLALGPKERLAAGLGTDKREKGLVGLASWAAKQVGA